MTSSQVSFPNEYPPGLVLWVIVNQVEFDSLYPTRDGANVDENNLIEALRPFQVEIRVWRDFRLNEVLQSLRELYEELNNNASKYSGLVVLGMSHGEQRDGLDYLVTKDCKHLLTDKFVDILQNCYCVGLMNRPKVFLFNMCRGSTRNIEIQDSSEPFPAVRHDSRYWTKVRKNNLVEDGLISFKKGDYLVAHSTIKGYVSNRHRRYGSIFVHEMVKSIVEMMAYENHNFEDVIRFVCMKTSRHQFSGLNASQLPELTTTLRARFRFLIKGNIIKFHDILTKRYYANVW